MLCSNLLGLLQRILDSLCINISASLRLVGNLCVLTEELKIPTIGELIIWLAILIDFGGIPLVLSKFCMILRAVLFEVSMRQNCPWLCSFMISLILVILGWILILSRAAITKFVLSRSVGISSAGPMPFATFTK